MIEIILPATLESDLCWQEQEQLAEQAQQKGNIILWKLDFGFDRNWNAFDDPSHFQSFVLAVDQFSKTLAQKFADISKGVVLYQGDCRLCDRMIWSSPLRDYFQEWLNEVKSEEEAQNLFCINLLAEYLHRLASYLPDTLTPYAFFSSHEKSLARRAQLFSKERFGTICLSLQEEVNTVAFVLPKDEFCTKEGLQTLDRFFAELVHENISFRIISEALLTEEWQGVETLYVWEEGISQTGKRMLQGFEASGGTVIWKK